jgi:4-amino-4-deoxy-L-arabinose transferase-like glycosyltransferase
LGLITLATALTPAWNGDTVQFHLPLIRVFLSAHALAVPRAIPYGYFPQGFEVLAATAYALAGQTAAQLVNPALFCLAILVLYRISRSCGISRSWAITGAGLALSIPFVHWTGSVMKNDLSLAAYQLAALLCYFRWRETRVFRWILLSAFFIAMSFGIKYVAVFGTLPWALAVAAGLWREPRKFRRIALVGATLVVFGCIWSARAYVGTGDPFSPAGAERAVRHSGSRPGHRALDRILQSAYNTHFRGKLNFQSPSENPMGIALLSLLPLWFIPRARQTSWRTEAVLWLYVLLYYPPWAYESAVLRYAIAPAVLLAMLGAARLALFPRTLVVTAMGAALVFSLPVVILMEMAPAQIPLLAKRIDAATFLRRTLPPYGAVEFLSQHAKPSDSIASVGDWAAGYTPNPANFHLTYLNGRRYSPAFVNRILQPNDSYIIFPRRPNLAELESAAREHHTISRLYQDQDFVVDAVSEPRP